MKDTVYCTLLLLITNSQSIFGVIAPYILFLLSIFKIHVYKITSREKINFIRNNVKNDFCSSYDENGNPIGIVVHKHLFPKYICWNDMSIGNSLHILSSKKTRTELTNQVYKPNKVETLTIDKPLNVKKNSQTIEYFSRTGNYSYFYYNKRDLYINHDYNKHQKYIANNITEYYKLHNSVCVYLYGKVGVGKTYLAYLLCKGLNGSLCDTYEPTCPGDYLQDLYSYAQPTKEKPLILLLDEVDITLTSIHDDKVYKHKNVPVQIHNKVTWNNFLDKIGMGIYPYLILILSSNKPISEINNMDASYLRKGRVNIVSELINDKID